MSMDQAGLARIKLLLLDVDGVMTDGRIVLDDNGVESKFFNVRDGHGLKMLQRAGLRVGILTGRKSRVVDLRAAELGVEIVFQGAKNKLEVYERMLAEQSLTDEEVAFAGDDVIDLPVLRRVGLALAPADAVDEVREVVHYVCRAAGGHGAVREIVELLLRGQGLWEQAMARYR